MKKLNSFDIIRIMLSCVVVAGVVGFVLPLFIGMSLGAWRWVLEVMRG